MRLLEFQAKRILQDYGISVPQGRLLASLEGLEEISFPAILKAQVPVGGRGKAGAVRLAGCAEEGSSMAGELFGLTLKGYPVSCILAEQQVSIQKELYLAYLVDKEVNLPLVMASPAGGIDIEEVAQREPDRIVKKHVDPLLGIQGFFVRPIAKILGIENVQGLGQLLQTMQRIFQERDATLIEINPLAVTPEGLVALDAKILLDDKAAFRQQGFFEALREEQKRLDRRLKTKAEEMAEAMGITYVPLEGDIGIIADGAGTGMLTLDLIHQYGGRAANFCEMGGLSNAETMEKSMGVVLANPRVKVLLIGLIGGMTRMDEMAEGIVQYLKKADQSLPIVIRMCGTKADAGKARLQGVGIETHEDLSAAVRDAVRQAQEL